MLILTLSVFHVLYVTVISSHSRSYVGEETPVPVLHQCQGKRMGDGVTNSLHQSDWWPTRQRGPARGVKEWSCEYFEKMHSLIK